MNSLNLSRALHGIRQLATVNWRQGDSRALTASSSETGNPQAGSPTLARGVAPPPGAADLELFLRQHLSGVASCTPVEALSKPAGGRVAVARQSLPRELVERIDAQAKARAVTLASIVHVAWALVLERASGQGVVVLGTGLAATLAGGVRPERGPDAAATRPSSALTVLPMRIELGEQGVLDGVQQTDALLAQFAPYRTVLRAGADVALTARLMSSVLEYREDDGGRVLPAAAGDTADDGRIVAQPEGLGLTMQVSKYGRSLELMARVVAPASPERVCAMMAQALERLVDALEGAPSTPLASLDVLLPSERERLISEWNQTDAAYPSDKCLQELFEARVEEHPTAVAVVGGDRALTYAELNERANRLARCLIERGVCPGDRVALALPRSVDLVVAQIATVKCGAAYVPLDESAPPGRYAFLIEDSGAKLVLTMDEASGVYGDAAPLLVQMQALPLEAGVAGDTRLPLSSELPAYVMYTSGSTGQPKGVEVPHRAVTRLLLNNGYATFDATSRVAFIANPAFDPSTLEVWAALLCGGTIVVIDRDTVRAPERLRSVLLEQRVTVLNLTSGMYNQYAEALGSALAQLDYLLVGGDVVDPRMVARVLRDTPPRHFVYTYGPTETTLFATAWEVRQVERDMGALAIGRPIANTRVYVLDEAGRLAPIGTTGELYIGGAGVALGYLRRPESTAARFVPDTFSGEAGARLYRTGDLARWNDDGMLEFRGRNDVQIKVRGFRIEPGEIEAKLRSHPGVREAAVLARLNCGGEKRLVAYYTPFDGPKGELAPEALRHHLLAILPEYMVPVAYVSMSELPLTANGKVDRRALPAPKDEAYSLRDYDLPQGDIEQTLARLWEELLGVERVGRHDSFFDLGGDSILVIKLIWKLRAKGWELHPSRVAEHPTLEKLAACLSQVEEHGGEQGVLEGELPCTPVQRKFFSGNLSNPHHHNQAQVFELSSRCDLRAMSAMFRVLERQHDILRVRYRSTSSGWVQQYGRLSEEPPLEEMDATDIDEAGASGWLYAVGSDVQSRLNLHAGPLYQVRLIHFAARDVLLIVVHHLAMDGVSWRIISDDLNRLLSQARRGEGFALEQKTWSFRQWGEGLLDYATSSGMADELRDYWCPSALLGAVASPTELADAFDDSLPGRVVSSLPKDETARLLRDTPRALKTPVNDVLLAALGLALRQTFGPARWRIQLEGHGREVEVVPGADVARTVGWFTAEFPFVIDATGASLPAVLDKVKGDLRSVPHKGVGYGVLLYLRSDLSQAERASLQSLQSRISFNYLGRMGTDLVHDELRVSPLPSGMNVSPANKSMLLLDILAQVNHEGALEVSFQYQGKVRPHVERLATAFLETVVEVNAHGKEKAGRIGMNQTARGRVGGTVTREATPADYPAVRAVCAATMPSTSRWVGEQLGPRTWLDLLLASDECAKFVLEVDGEIVGYLVGSRDIDRFDFSGLRATTCRSAVLLAKGLQAWMAGAITQNDVRELVRLLTLYGFYTYIRTRASWRVLRGAAVRRRNIGSHFNVLPAHRSSGGMLRLIRMWEEWLRGHGEPHAFLHIESFHGLIGNRALQNDFARGLGYERRADLHPVYWAKKLQTGEASSLRSPH